LGDLKGPGGPDYDDPIRAVEISPARPPSPSGTRLARRGPASVSCDAGHERTGLSARVRRLSEARVARSWLAGYGLPVVGASGSPKIRSRAVRHRRRGSGRPARRQGPGPRGWSTNQMWGAVGGLGVAPRGRGRMRFTAVTDAGARRGAQAKGALMRLAAPGGIEFAARYAAGDPPTAVSASSVGRRWRGGECTPAGGISKHDVSSTFFWRPSRAANGTPPEMAAVRFPIAPRFEGFRGAPGGQIWRPRPGGLPVAAPSAARGRRRAARCPELDVFIHSSSTAPARVVRPRRRAAILKAGRDHSRLPPRCCAMRAAIHVRRHATGRGERSTGDSGSLELSCTPRPPGDGRRRTRSPRRRSVFTGRVPRCP